MNRHGLYIMAETKIFLRCCGYVDNLEYQVTHIPTVQQQDYLFILQLVKMTRKVLLFSLLLAIIRLFQEQCQ